MTDQDKTLFDWENEYKDDVDVHRKIIETFTTLVDGNPKLKDHRDFVQKHVYGFGERAFHWMWKLLVDQMPNEFKFVEVGVYKGQVVSLVRMLSDMTGKTASITGVTPLSSTSGVTGKFSKFPETDYMQHIKDLHNKFSLKFSEEQIVVGDSTDSLVQARASERGPFDLVYIDGCHEYDFVVKDLNAYGSMVKVGGYLIIDDSSNFKKTYWGKFWGIEDVSKAVRDVVEKNPIWKEVVVVLHNRVFRRVG